MGVIKQFNSEQGPNQIFVDDFANISDSLINAISGLPWTTPLSICGASFSRSGSSKVLNITPKTLVVVNGVVFGSDVTVQMTSSQYLYAVCVYDTSTPRQKSGGGQYYQAVVRSIKVTDSPLSDTDLSNASVFPGIGNYPILAPNFQDSTGSIQINTDGTISPFVGSLVPDSSVNGFKILGLSDIATSLTPIPAGSPTLELGSFNLSTISSGLGIASFVVPQAEKGAPPYTTTYIIQNNGAAQIATIAYWGNKNLGTYYVQGNLTKKFTFYDRPTNLGRQLTMTTEDLSSVYTGISIK